MDDLRIDNLARSVAALGPRRSLLRGFIGIGAALAWHRHAPGVSAQPGTLGPGDPCYDDSQCSPTVMNYSSKATSARRVCA